MLLSLGHEETELRVTGLPSQKETAHTNRIQKSTTKDPAVKTARYHTANGHRQTVREDTQLLGVWHLLGAHTVVRGSGQELCEGSGAFTGEELTSHDLPNTNEAQHSAEPGVTTPASKGAGLVGVKGCSPPEPGLQLRCSALTP